MFLMRAPRLPLRRRECSVIERVLEQNRPALAMLAEARGKGSLRWDVWFDSPMCETRCGHLFVQDNLARLLEGQLLLAHVRGNDGQAMQSTRDLLMMSRAVEQMLPGFSHTKAAAISSSVCDRLIEISPGLRIGSAEGEVAKEEVVELIRSLLDESGVVEAQLRHLRWLRASHVQLARAYYNDRLWSGRTPQVALPWQVVMFWEKPAAMADTREILRLSTEILQAAEASEDAPGFARMAATALTRLERVDHNFGWQAIARPQTQSYRWFMQRHYLHLAERRLAATALAIRLYVVDHGSVFPKTLEELTPAYLAAVPADPMARKGNGIKYIADEMRPRIYSIGSDGLDDGGSEYMPRGHDWLDAEDLVVHLTLQAGKTIERDEDETLNYSVGGFYGGAGADGASSAKGRY